MTTKGTRTAEAPNGDDARAPRGRGVDAKSSAELAYSRIKRAIVTGELEPDAVLVELSLAEWCGVSRTPVREALTRLEQDGLIIRSERGLTIRSRSPEEILDIYETRIVLEATAAALAAERATRFDHIRLQRFLTQMETDVPIDPTTCAELNREFHREIWFASRNESLADLLERLNLHLGRYPETTLSYPGRWEQALIEHRALVEAIIAHDAPEASNLAKAHFCAARDIRVALWEEAPESLRQRTLSR